MHKSVKTDLCICLFHDPIHGKDVHRLRMEADVIASCFKRNRRMLRQKLHLAHRSLTPHTNLKRWKRWHFGTLCEMNGVDVEAIVILIECDLHV